MNYRVNENEPVMTRKCIFRRISQVKMVLILPSPTLFTSLKMMLPLKYFIRRVLRYMWVFTVNLSQSI